MQKLGERIKQRRQCLKMSLKELAEKVQVTPSLLSQIEKGKSLPSIVTLKSISGSLSTTVSELIGENETYEINPVVSAENRVLLKETSLSKLFSIPHSTRFNDVETFLIRISKNGDTSNLITPSSSEDFFYVLQGSIEFTLGSRLYKMKQGDSILVHSGNYNLIRNCQEPDAEIIWVVISRK